MLRGGERIDRVQNFSIRNARKGRDSYVRWRACGDILLSRTTHYLDIWKESPPRSLLLSPDVCSSVECTNGYQTTLIIRQGNYENTALQPRQRRHQKLHATSLDVFTKSHHTRSA